MFWLLTMVKAGKLGKINKIMDLLDPISNTMKIAGKTVKYCGIPNGKISIIDKLKQADIEKLPVDENGLRIADIDGEAIPIGNKNALEKIEGKGVKIFSENLNTTISNLKKKAKYVLEGTGEYEKVRGHHPLAKKAFEGIEEYDYRKAFSVSPKELDKVSNITNLHPKITGQQSKLYTEWRRANPNKVLGWVVKALEELKDKGIKSIKNIPWNGIND